MYKKFFNIKHNLDLFELFVIFLTYFYKYKIKLKLLKFINHVYRSLIFITYLINYDVNRLIHLSQLKHLHLWLNIK